MLKLETLMENAVDKNFDKLEIWTLRNVLCLPRGEAELAKWVRLGHYEGVGSPPTSEPWTPEKLYTLRRKLVETQKLHVALLAEKTRNDAHLTQLRALLSPAQPTKRESTSPSRTAPSHPPPTFAFLTHSPAAQALGLQALPPPTPATASTPTPLATHTTFTTSQLPALRQLLATLKPHLARTALPVDARAAGERKLYLESQSRRILEKRGVDARQGVEGVGERGRVGAEEVRGLEGVVEGLRRGRGEEMDVG